MSSTDPVSSITNCYRLIVSLVTQYTASSSRNAQLSQLDLVSFYIYAEFRNSEAHQELVDKAKLIQEALTEKREE